MVVFITVYKMTLLVQKINRVNC